MSFIYFVQAEFMGRVKIGRTKDVKGRLVSLRVASPCPLRLLAIILGGPKEERELHRRFSHLRVHSEWYEVRADLSEYLATLPPYEGASSEPAPVDETKLKKYIRDHGIFQRHLARKLGVSSARISQLVNGLDHPNLPMMRRIAEITGGAVMPNDWISAPNTDTAA